jgi:hypothetical protein
MLVKGKEKFLERSGEWECCSMYELIAFSDLSMQDLLRVREPLLLVHWLNPSSAWHEESVHGSAVSRREFVGATFGDGDVGEEQGGCRERAGEGEESRGERKTL